MCGAEALAHAPSPVAQCAVNASSMPSQIASPSKSFAGAKTIGRPFGVPTVIFALSSRSRSEPSPVSFTQTYASTSCLNRSAAHPATSTAANES